MPVIIGMRTDPKISKFRSFMSALIQIPSQGKRKTLVLASPYFDSRVPDCKPSPTLASMIYANCDALMTVFGNGPTSNIDWPKWYIRFREEIMRVAPKISFTPKIYSGGNTMLHSKIALIMLDGDVVAGIIGSSNLTLPAWSENPEDLNYNCETDILLWDDAKLSDISEHFLRFDYESYNGTGDEARRKDKRSQFPSLDVLAIEARPAVESVLGKLADRPIWWQLQDLYYSLDARSKPDK